MGYLLEPSINYSALLQLYRKLTGFKNRAEDHYQTRARQRGEDAFFQANFIIEAGEPIGIAEFGKHPLADSPSSANMNIILAHNAWNPECFHDLVSKIEEVLRHEGFDRLTTTEFDNRRRNELVKRGFDLDLEFVESEFDLTSLRKEAYPTLPEGFLIKSFGDLATIHGASAYEFVTECVREILRDIPGQASYAPLLTPQKLKDAWQGSHFFPTGCFFLEHASLPIGVHNIVSYSKGMVTAGVTGILPAYRRRGLMRLLERHGMVWASKEGFALYRSDNAVGNPMFALNLQLGFHEVRRYCELTKNLFAKSGPS